MYNDPYKKYTKKGFDEKNPPQINKYIITLLNYENCKVIFIRNFI